MKAVRECELRHVEFEERDQIDGKGVPQTEGMYWGSHEKPSFEGLGHGGHV